MLGTAPAAASAPAGFFMRGRFECSAGLLLPSCSGSQPRYGGCRGRFLSPAARLRLASASQALNLIPSFPRKRESRRHSARAMNVGRKPGSAFDPRRRGSEAEGRRHPRRRRSSFGAGADFGVRGPPDFLFQVSESARLKSISLLAFLLSIFVCFRQKSLLSKRSLRFLSGPESGLFRSIPRVQGGTRLAMLRVDP
jgi:hypothetical protein